MRSAYFVPLAAGMLPTAALAAASGHSLEVLPTTSSAVTYRLHEEANGPDGARQFDRRISLVLNGDGYGAVLSSPGNPDESFSLTLDGGALRSNGPNVAEDRDSTVEALGFVVSLANHQGPIVMGQTWPTTTTVDLPGGETPRVPLAVTADSVQGDDVTLAATGNGSGIVHARGHSANAKIDLVLQASFHDGHVVSATATRTLTAHVPFRTITFTDTWSITR